MAKAKKLPSGSWRVQVFSHKDINGKSHYESFTAPTKAEAEMKAAAFSATKKSRVKHDLTVADALSGYISAKEAVLSPATVRGYVRMQKKNYSTIEKKKIRSLTSENMQIFVSDLSNTLSPKTVRNVYALLTASIALYAPDMTFKVTLPAKQVKRPVSPSDDVVKVLYDSAYPKLRICLGFAMCGVRRGEICALKYEDINDGVVHIHADMVKDKKGKWIYKEIPKTSGSDRFLRLPDFLIEEIGEGNGFIININPNTVTKQFLKYRNKLGMTIRLHDLRHYFASTAAVLDIPDTYTADMGGWQRGGSVMKSVYQNNIASMSDYYNDRINQHLDDVIKKK